VAKIQKISIFESDETNFKAGVKVLAFGNGGPNFCANLSFCLSFFEKKKHLSAIKLCKEDMCFYTLCTQRDFF
jgi:hypothetical protein